MFRSVRIEHGKNIEKEESIGFHIQISDMRDIRKRDGFATMTYMSIRFKSYSDARNHLINLFSQGSSQFQPMQYFGQFRTPDREQ